MKKHYPLFALSVAFALCGQLSFAQESGGAAADRVHYGARTGLQAYSAPLHWRVRGLDLSQLFGTMNTATGTDALTSCTSCYYNVADGYQAMNSCTTCTENVAVGLEALFSNTTGSENTAVGWAALNVSSASGNTAIGYTALERNQSGTANTAVGTSTLVSSTASNNTAVGYYSLYANSSGYANIATGGYSLYENTTGEGNVANGYSALYENSSGGANTAIGEDAMTGNQTGFGNTCVGSSADVNNSNLTYAMALGANSGVTSSNTAVIGSPAVTSVGGYANWTNFSDGRYKKNIQSNVPGLAFINKLSPVTYTLDIDGIAAKLYQGKRSGAGLADGSHSPTDDPVMKQAMQEKSAITYTGFVAQDVEKAADSLNFVFSGIDKPKNIDESFYGLRYGDFVPPLVKAVQELSVSSNSKDSAINAQQASIDSLRMQVAELRAMMQALKSTASNGRLDQNAPNPFNGSTVIGYNIPTGAASAQMQISDIMGNVLAVIPLTGMGPGTITADVSGYAAGTYTYSLIVDGRLVGTKKMVSVR